jgi:hypothetical protein
MHEFSKGSQNRLNLKTKKMDVQMQIQEFRKWNSRLTPLLWNKAQEPFDVPNDQQRNHPPSLLQFRANDATARSKSPDVWL